MAKLGEGRVNKSTVCKLGLLLIVLTSLFLFSNRHEPPTLLATNTEFFDTATSQLSVHTDTETNSTIPNPLTGAVKAMKVEKYGPHFMIIGQMKSGTWALGSFLRLHEDVVMKKRPVHFFDRNESYSEGLEWYKTLIPYSTPTQLVGDKTPRYFSMPYVPERIHNMNSSMKLILVVREPVERSLSHYVHYMSKNENTSSFESMVLLDNGEINSTNVFIRKSDYSLFIDDWYKWFPKEQLKIVDGNLLKTNPVLVMKDIQEFLGVRQYVDEKFFTYNIDTGFYSCKTGCKRSGKGRKHPTIDPSLNKKLLQYFEPKNEIFFKKIEKTFEWKSH